jgi:glucose repression regulatory protein TUP1
MRDGEIFFRSVAWSPDGQWLAAGTEDKTVKVWNVATGQRKPDFMGHEMDIYAVDYSKDGRYLVSGSGDRKYVTSTLNCLWCEKLTRLFIG